MRRLLFWGDVLVSLPTPTPAPWLCCGRGRVGTAEVCACSALLLPSREVSLSQWELSSSADGPATRLNEQASSRVTKARLADLADQRGRSSVHTQVLSRSSPAERRMSSATVHA